MLTRIGAPLPQDLQDRGFHILETLEGTRRPNPSAPKARRDAFKTLCDEVQVWLRDEIAELRRVKPSPKKTAPKGTPRPKVGHA